MANKIDRQLISHNIYKLYSHAANGAILYSSSLDNTILIETNVHARPITIAYIFIINVCQQSILVHYIEQMIWKTDFPIQIHMPVGVCDTNCGAYRIAWVLGLRYINFIQYLITPMALSSFTPDFWEINLKKKTIIMTDDYGC